MQKRTQITAALYSRLNDWSAVRKTVMGENLFQTPNQNTANADFGEIKRRLTTISDEKIALIADEDSDTSRLINLLAIYKTYPLFRDFMAEKVFDRFLSMIYELSKWDYFHFVEDKKVIDEKLATKNEITIQKSQSFSFQILRETGFLNGEAVVPRIIYGAPADIIKKEGQIYSRAFLQGDKYAGNIG